MAVAHSSPTAERYPQWITAGNIQAQAGLGTGTTIANAICKAVAATPLCLPSRRPLYRILMASDQWNFVKQ